MVEYLSRGIVCSECKNDIATYTLYADKGPQAYLCDNCTDIYKKRRIKRIHRQNENLQSNP